MVWALIIISRSFWFDTVVILADKITIDLNSSDAFHGTVMGMAHGGTVLGAIGGIPLIKWKKKESYYGLNFIFWLSAIGSACKMTQLFFVF
jgi:hypothetical protein